MRTLLGPLHETTGSTRLADSGDEALDFLYNHGDYSNTPHLNLILLSTGLPNDTTATDVLQEMAETEKLRGTPIIVLGEDENEEKSGESMACVCMPTSRSPLSVTASVILPIVTGELNRRVALASLVVKIGILCYHSAHLIGYPIGLLTELTLTLNMVNQWRTRLLGDSNQRATWLLSSTARILVTLACLHTSAAQFAAPEVGEQT